MGSTAQTLTVSTNAPKTTAGASSPILGKASAFGNTGTTVTGGSLNASTNFGNGNIINPDSTQLVQSALTAVGNALNTAIANRDVVAAGNSTNSPPAVTQIGTQTPTSGLVDSISGGLKSFFSSGGIKIALLLAFPVVFLLLWLIFRPRKKS
jgi:hypothetical protein